MSTDNIITDEGIPSPDRSANTEPMFIESAGLAGFPFNKIKAEAAAYSCTGKPRIVLNDERIICYNISDSLDIFPHLTLDSAFRILLYVSIGGDGLFCTVCAMQKGFDPEPLNIVPAGQAISWNHPLLGVNPLEVVLRDGTPESFMEGIMYRDFLENMTESIGLGTFENEILTAVPAEYEKYKSGFDIKINNWTPKIVWNTVSLWRHRAAGTVYGRPRETITMETNRYDSLRYYNEVMAMLKRGRTGPYPNTTVSVIPNPNLDRSLVNYISSMVVMEKK